MKLNDELFVIPDGDNVILFLPLEGVVARANQGTAKLLKDMSRGEQLSTGDVEAILVENGFVVADDVESVEPSEERPPEFNPTRVTLCLTSDCNLRCTYCYGAAGEHKHYMKWEIAESAIDFIVSNALKTNSKRVSLDFHGGGEPTFGAAWPLLQRAVQYAKEQCERSSLRCHASTGTNGVLSPQQRNWIVDNMHSVSLSFDGTEAFQNQQRPMCSGAPSFPHLADTIAFFESRSFSYDIRATITAESAPLMREMVDFIARNTTRKRFHVEPVDECGRCSSTGTTSPDPKTFLAHLIDAMKYSKTNYGIEVYYSGARLGNVHTRFCGAVGSNFIVTPSGGVTCCNEITLPNDPQYRTFVFGAYKGGSFTFDTETMRKLASRTVRNLAGCENCFAKYSCAGDCPARVGRVTGSLFSVEGNSRCVINRGVVLHLLREHLRKEIGHVV